MPMYVASTTKTRQHAYPATVDTALTMIHLDVYVRVANVIIIFIINNTYNGQANKVRSTPFL